jgi:DNA repair exonuclease SbcCD ATPase subunit
MIRFKRIKWKNLLSTGAAWTEVDLDRNPTTLVIGRNGAGKSTILDALTFALFGKPFRKINKPLLVNSVNNKELVVEVVFTIGKTEYKVIRGMKPSVFEIYQNGNLLEQTAAVKDYQDNLENNILKLNFTSFTQIVVLGSRMFVPFMQLSTGQRREIIEDLLDIKIFTAMNILLKDRLAENKEAIRDLEKSIASHSEKSEVHASYIKDILQNAKRRVEKIEAEIAENTELVDELLDKLGKIDDEIGNLANSESKVSSIQSKISEIRGIESKFADKKRRHVKEHKFYQDNENCPTCTQPISADVRDDKLKEKTDRISEIEIAESQLADKLIELEVQFREESTRLQKYRDLVTRSTTLSSEVSKYNHVLQRLRSEIKDDETDTSQLENAKAEVEKIEREITSLETEREKLIMHKGVLDLAADLLKDKGIKTQIVKQYVPVLNKLVNKFLAAMDFFVNFELDENFDEIIKSRHRDEFSYASFSEGEKMKIDLALLLTWRAVAKMKNSTNTNLLILDEVFDASLDADGCDDFMKLLNELGKDSNVFVISHKGDILQDKFRSVIRFEKAGNYSRMA